MSRLQETNWQGIKGWQWDDGPIFVGEDSRQWAVEYGMAFQRIEELTKLAELKQGRLVGEERMAELKKLIPNAGVNQERRWQFHWLDGKVVVGIGNTVSEAFTQLGYGAGAMAAMDHYQEIK